MKYDNCNNMGIPAQERYGEMAKAISNVPHPMFYAICNWGNENVTEWAPAIAQSWRTTVDVQVGEQKGNSFY